MKKVLVFAAGVEVVTGLALLIVPSRVGHLLFGEGLNGVAIPIARVTGIALIALGVHGEFVNPRKNGAAWAVL
jgi:hypothetical protein